ncbi:MAG: glycosyltransferase [Nanoarchaeota archaeon]|nr:glycosyltransferase [Nanoarchaeota archaeon]
MEKLSIIIPAYNEEARIGRTLEQYLAFFKQKKKQKIVDVEIIVVLNACKDKTLEVCNKFKCKELKILNFEQGGKGFAVVEGFKEALKGDSNYIGFTDADMSTPPEAFYDLYANIKDVDGVIANRWDKNSKISVEQTLLRKIMSRGFNVIIRTLFIIPHRDTQCGAKLFKREKLMIVLPKLGSSEWSFDVDLLFYMRREKAKIKSIPTTWNDEKGSKINIKKTPIKMFLSAVRLRLVHSPLKFIVRVHNIMPEKFKIHNLLK